MTQQPDFLDKPMNEMTREEWESLCDGCGLCCQIRLEDIDTGEMALSNAVCRYLCLESHRCTDYANRTVNVPDCVQVTPKNVQDLYWMPATCAYRLVANGEPLPDWHHLICGDRERVHSDGPSMRGEVVSEDEVEWE